MDISLKIINFLRMKQLYQKIIGDFFEKPVDIEYVIYNH